MTGGNGPAAITPSGSMGFDFFEAAAKRGDCEALEDFLGLYGDGHVDHTDYNGNAALHFAASQNDEDAVVLLLAHGANPNLQNDNGNTPFLCCIQKPKADAGIVQLLVDAGARIGIKNKQGYDARHYAAQNDMAPDVRDLLRRVMAFEDFNVFHTGVTTEVPVLQNALRPKRGRTP